MKLLATLAGLLFCPLVSLAQNLTPDLVLFVERAEADRYTMQKTCSSIKKDGSYRIEKVGIDHTHPNEFTAKAAEGQLPPEKIRELTSILNSQELANSKQRATLYIGPGFTDGEYALVFIVRGSTVQVLSHANSFGILGSVDGTVRIVEKPQKEYKSLLDWVKQNTEKQKLKFTKMRESACAQPASPR